MKNKFSANQNIFGSKLEELLTVANVKNYTIARTLSYDVSYISKWITGKALPSKKNIEKTLSVISRVIAMQGSGESFENMCRKLGAENENQIRAAIKQELKDAYYQTVGDVNESKYIVNNSSLKISPESRYPLLMEYAKQMDTDKSYEIAVMADLFSLDHASKLRMAGIDNHRFMIKEKRKDITINFILDLSKLDSNSVYDVILLIHMMTCYSLTDFHLYYSELSSGKLIIAVKDEFAGISLLGNNRQFLCTAASKDRKVTEEIYESVRNSINPDSSLFISTDMESLLISHEYLQTLLSQNARWLVGHVTEHFLPPELFDGFLEECFDKDTITAEEAERAYLLAVNAIGKNQVRIMVYNRALVDFVLSGELDFFNHKIILSPEQRKLTLTYLREKIMNLDNPKIKLMIDGFSDDFKYITNPCMFLSESLDYLRLENKQYENNLMLIKDEYARNIFDDFFENIWCYDQSIFDTGIDDIVRRLDNFIETSELLMNVKQNIE